MYEKCYLYTHTSPFTKVVPFTMPFIETYTITYTLSHYTIAVYLVVVVMSSIARSSETPRSSESSSLNINGSLAFARTEYFV